MVVKFNTYLADPEGTTHTEEISVAIVAEHVRDLDVTFPGGVNVGGGRAIGVYLRRPPSEHRRAIYCSKAHYEPMSVGGAAASILGIKAVVVTVGTESIGDMGGGLGGIGGNGLWVRAGEEAKGDI